MQIKPFVTESERKKLLSLIDSPNFTEHKSPKGKGGWQFCPVKYRKYDAILMKIDPHVEIDWHTDRAYLSRRTVILHPLTDNYAPIHFRDDKTVEPIIFDTQVEHAVYNNSTKRLNLQLNFDLDFDTVIDDNNSIIWKTLKEIYNE